MTGLPITNIKRLWMQIRWNAIPIAIVTSPAWGLMCALLYFSYQEDHPVYGPPKATENQIALQRCASAGGVLIETLPAGAGRDFICVKMERI